MLQQFKLIRKKNLTPDVYEMVFLGERELVMKPGQFVTFLIDKI
jgi:NAD(P)H-flavin reductase